MHKIQKTYGITLINNDVNEEFIIEYIGHWILVH